MARFRFLHAADLHLDSPLVGLARKSSEYAERVDNASRSAFDNLIQLAIEEECRFVLIAGDVFDGQWRNYKTGLFFAERMRRLQQAGIRVLMILGNHDAENRFVSRLELSDNVQILPQAEAGTLELEDLETVIHGRSFPQRDVHENIALQYPARVEGRFNIGLLHTACVGSEGHAPYAPCSVEQLVNHGYDYWALGHVHARKVLSKEPYVVYPGNLQGRNVKEIGDKGATLVTVEGGRVVHLEHRALDVVRWVVEEVNVSGLASMAEVHGLIREQFQAVCAAADDRGVALRLRLGGQTPLHHELMSQHSFYEEMETLAANISGDLWIEKIELKTLPPERSEATDPTVAGKLRRVIEELVREGWVQEQLEDRLSKIKPRMPVTAHTEELFEALRSSSSAQAVEIALALIERGQE